MKLKKGFTLIELLVVIAIIGLLSSIVLASLNSARGKARDAARASEVKQIKTALEFYYDQNSGVYPSANGGANDGWGFDLISGGTTPLPTLLKPWLSNISPDPTGNNWQYVRGGVANSYGLYVYTEKLNGYCLTGVNVTPSWWANPPSVPDLPACPF